MTTYIQLGTNGSFVAPTTGKLILKCNGEDDLDCMAGSIVISINGVPFTVPAFVPANSQGLDTSGTLGDVIAGNTYVYTANPNQYWTADYGIANFNADGNPEAGNDAEHSSRYPIDNTGAVPFSLVGFIAPPPSAPVGLDPQLVGDTLFLTGTANPPSDNVVFYKLYSSNTPNGAYTLAVEMADEPAFELPNPSSPTYYKFSSVNAAGSESSLSAYVEVIPSQEDEMERATIFQGLTLAAETSLGTLAGSPKVFFLPSVIAEVKPMQQNKTFPGRGVKGKLGKTRSKEYSEFSLSGPLGYDELVLLLLAHTNTTTATTVNTSTTAAKWNLMATSGLKDSPTTYTVQVGSAVDGATQAAGCFVSDFSIKVTDTEATFTATMIGMNLVDSVNYIGQYPYLGAATEILTYPVHESGIGIYYGSNLGSMTPLTHLSEFSYDCKNRFRPATFRDPTKPSYSGIVEGAFDGSGKLTVEEDSNAAALLAMTRTDNPIGSQSQTYIALQATGPVIDSPNAVDYALTMEWPAIIVKSPSRTDKADVWSGEYDFEVANDATIGCMTANVTAQVLAIH